MASQLKVASVRGRDLLGLEEFAIKPGKVTKFLGRNRSGKTSRLRALKAGLGLEGNLVKIARVGDDGQEVEPEVVLELEGAGAYYLVERNGKKVRVRQRVGDSAALEDVPQPQAFLSSLFDGTGSNPVAFLTARDKDRALMLLEALPLTFDRAACLAEIGITEEELAEFGPVPAGVLHPLEETARIRESVYRARTGVNRDKTGAEKTVEQIQRKIPAKPPEDPGLAIEELDQECRQIAEAGIEARSKADAARDAAVAKAKHERDLVVAEVKGDFKAQASKLRREHEARAAEIRAEAERRIAEDLAATNAAVGAIQDGGETQIDEAEAACEKAIEAANREHAEASEELEKLRAQLAEKREQLAGLRSQREAAQAVLALQQQVEEFESRADGYRKESDRLTRAIERLDAHRRKLAENLPIDGLEIKDREITVHRVPYDQLNAEQQVRLAVEVSVLRAQGRLPIVFVDGAESLDQERFDALVEELLRRDVQAFIARREDHDLEVESSDPPAEVVDLAEARG